MQTTFWKPVLSLPGIYKCGARHHDVIDQKSEKVTTGLRKKPLDFGGSPDHVTLGLGLG